MVRDTSIESYVKVQNSGLLSRRLMCAYVIVFRYGPITGRDANTMYLNFHGKNNLNQFRSYLSQLQDLGVIETTKQVKCSITGRSVYLFDATGNAPIRVKKPSMADKKKELLATVHEISKEVWPWCASEFQLLRNQLNNL